MTPDQVTGFFDAGEAFVEGTIGAALVVLWLVALGLHLARPYMAHTTGKFTLRLGADLWWIIYVGLRDVLLLQVFLGSFIFFYPDVVTGQALPVAGGLAAVCAFAALLIKLTTKGDADLRWFRVQVLVSSENPDLALPLCYLSAALAGILGIVAVAFNLRLTSVRRPTSGSEE